MPLPDDHINDLNAEVLFDDELVVAAGSNSRWARRRNIELAELINEPWILPPPGTGIILVSRRRFKRAALVYPRQA
jgi:DNA-binding transcriptional LysR family regulator